MRSSDLFRSAVQKASNGECRDRKVTFQSLKKKSWEIISFKLIN